MFWLTRSAAGFSGKIYFIAPVILQYALLSLRYAEPTRAESIFFDSVRVGSAHLKSNPLTQHESFKLDFR